ncbi:MAG: PDZ domain-containing protein [Gemmataceae bacterium]|nr:PDZ domain-containing protein [Gemmataceae bacterium]
MKLRSPLSTLMLFGMLLLVVGCPRNDPGKKDLKAKGKEAEDNASKLASELASQATDIAHYRDALRLLEAPLNKPETLAKYKLTEEDRTFFKEKAGLDDADLERVDQPAFLQLDAYCLDDAFLLRDALRQLSHTDPKESKLPAIVMDWIARRVLLHEQEDENLPPVWTLRRGYGNGLDRALIFLRMMRQVRCDSALVTAADVTDGNGPWLIATQPIPDSPAFMFVDPRLARVILGPDGKKPATWKELRDDPKLLAASGFDAEQAATLETRLVITQHEIAPRMRFIEKELELPGEPVYLFHDARKMLERFSELAPVQFWTSAKDKAHPYGRLRRFISKEDGGIDESQRQQQFQRHRVPLPRMLGHLAQYKLLGEQWADEGFQQINGMANSLYVQYGLKPGDMMLRGKLDDALARINRIKPALEEAEFGETPTQVGIPLAFDANAPLGIQFDVLPDDVASKLGAPKNALVVVSITPNSAAANSGLKPDDVILRVLKKQGMGKAQAASVASADEFERLIASAKDASIEIVVLRTFQQQVAEWREALRIGYLAKARKEPNAQSLLNQGWGDDQYALALQQPNIEMPKVEKRLLTRLLMRVVRDSLAPQTSYLVGHAWEDKAERALARGGQSDVAKKEAARAWSNARAAWSRYVDRYRLSAKSLADKMDAIAKQGRAEYAIEFFELLHLDLHESLEAQMQLAEAQTRTGMARAAEVTLKNLQSDVGDEETTARIRRHLEVVRDAVRPDAPGNYRRRAELLLRDWQNQGNVYWTARRAEENLARVKK